MSDQNPFHDTAAFEAFYGAFDSFNVGLIDVVQKRFGTRKRIVDLACGAGVSTHALHRVFPTSTLLGVDRSSELLSAFEHRFSHNALIRFLQADILDFIRTSRPEYDLVFLKSAFHLIENRVSIPDLLSLLSPKGVLVIAERSHRSAASFLLLDNVGKEWVERFQRLFFRRLAEFQAIEYRLETTSFGQFIQLEKSVYLNMIIGGALSFLQRLKESARTRLAEKADKGIPTEKLMVFEEFFLYCLEKRLPQEKRFRNLPTKNGAQLTEL
jgi:trans-aconitate methyltransferase